MEEFLKNFLCLIYDERKFFRTFRRMRNRHFAKNISADDQQYFTEEIFQDTFLKMDMNVPEKQLEKIYDLYHSEEISAWVPKTNLKNILKPLSDKYSLSMITNGSERIAKAILQHQEIDQYFKPKLCFYNARKPRLDSFKKFREEMNCEYGDLCHVGDDIHTDIRPAIELGMKAVYIPRGYEYRHSDEELMKIIKPTKTIHKLEELIDVVKTL